MTAADRSGKTPSTQKTAWKLTPRDLWSLGVRITCKERGRWGLQIGERTYGDQKGHRDAKQIAREILAILRF
ncbi:MAG: hypothetical protein WCD70_17155 [Alphaproteobacteria bacterium]